MKLGSSQLLRRGVAAVAAAVLPVAFVTACSSTPATDSGASSSSSLNFLVAVYLFFLFKFGFAMAVSLTVGLLSTTGAG